MRTVLITGARGQDGSYLAEQMLARGDQVVGTSRSRPEGAASPPGMNWVDWDPRDPGKLRDVLRQVRPDEVYNLAAMSSGSGMHDDPVAIAEANGLDVARLLEALYEVAPRARFCQASSSEMFGLTAVAPQCEETAFRPRSPYGAAKLFAHVMVQDFRRRHGLFACSAILYNHESPRRGEGFVTRRISLGAARIKSGRSKELKLGNLDVRRDWGYAPDYVRAMALMLGHGEPQDYVVATGQLHTVRDCCRIAFSHLGLDYREHVREDPRLFRPEEVVPLVGDAGKLRSDLGWRPEVGFEEMVKMMVDADMARIAEGG